MLALQEATDRPATVLANDTALPDRCSTAVRRGHQHAQSSARPQSAATRQGQMTCACEPQTQRPLLPQIARSFREGWRRLGQPDDVAPEPSCADIWFPSICSKDVLQVFRAGHRVEHLAVRGIHPVLAESCADANDLTADARGALGWVWTVSSVQVGDLVSKVGADKDCKPVATAVRWGCAQVTVSPTANGSPQHCSSQSATQINASTRPVSLR